MVQNPTENKRYRQKILKKDLLVAFLIITLPLLLNIHNYISSNHDTFSFSNFNYQLKGYSNLSNFVFYFFIDLVKFSYIIIWFITCKNKWYKAITALLILQSYLFIYTLNYEFHFIENKIQVIQLLQEIGIGILLTLFILPLLFKLRKQFNTYNVLLHVNKRLQEANTTPSNTQWSRKDWIFFFSIILIVLTYFVVTQYIYYLKISPNFDNSPIGLYRSKTTLYFILTGRITPILYLSIWLISCRYWWYHAILIPISVYVVQIVTSLQVNLAHIDKGEYVYIIPILLIVIGMLYLIRRSTLEKIERLSLLEEVELKIEELKDKKEDS
ncbi:hypothetical protein UJ101_01165 [Flavobacteriaceae bacterium UJ101]|nr:hypothetical protein UJ101_01165 [Flavobacteriaceae bacterium UJ101]